MLIQNPFMYYKVISWNYWHKSYTGNLYKNSYVTLTFMVESQVVFNNQIAVGNM